MMLGIGRHRVSVVSHLLGRSSTGTPYVAVLFADINGERITWYGYLSDAALERTVQSLAVLGWDPAQHEGRIDSLNGTGILADANADIVVEMEVYNGEARPKVKWINEPGGALGDGMPAEEASAFAVDLRAKILSAPRPKPSARPGPAKQAAPVAAPAAFNDDLPF